MGLPNGVWVRRLSLSDGYDPPVPGNVSICTAEKTNYITLSLTVHTSALPSPRR